MDTSRQLNALADLHATGGSETLKPVWNNLYSPNCYFTFTLLLREFKDKTCSIGNSIAHVLAWKNFQLHNICQEPYDFKCLRMTLANYNAEDPQLPIDFLHAPQDKPHKVHSSSVKLHSFSPTRPYGAVLCTVSF